MVLNLVRICGRLLSLVLCIFVIACNSNKDLNVVEGSDVDIRQAMLVERVSSFDQLFDSIGYIPLETNDTVLLGGRAVIKYVDDENIFIESESELYRFDISGKFLNRIGAKGQGPEEYLYPGFVSVEQKSKLVYLFTNKHLQVWTFDGKLIKKIFIDDSRNLVFGSVLDSQYLITMFREHLDGGGICSTIAWLDYSGKVVREEVLYKDDEEVKVRLWGTPTHSQLNGTHILKEEWSDTIYVVDGKGYRTFCSLNLEELAPSRKVVQELSPDKYQNYAIIDEVLIGARYLWVNLFHKETKYEVVVDMLNKTLLHSCRYTQKPEYGFGIANPAIQGMVFWPKYIDVKGDVYMLLQPSNLTEAGRRSLDEICGGSLMDESNPVLVCTRCKSFN